MQLSRQLEVAPADKKYPPAQLSQSSLVVPVHSEQATLQAIAPQLITVGSESVLVFSNYGVHSHAPGFAVIAFESLHDVQEVAAGSEQVFQLVWQVSQFLVATFSN